MKIKRRNLNRLIVEMINEVDVERAGTITGADALGPLLTILGGLSPSRVLKFVLKGAGGATSGAAVDGTVGAAAEGGVEATTSTLLKKALTGIKVVGSFAAPMIVLSAVWGAYAYLPKMIQKSIDQLNTVEGILKTMKGLKKRPLKLTDITNNPGQTLISKSWSQKEMVDYIASVMEVDEGRRLYTHLIADEYRDLNGIRTEGPVIGKDFSSAILKRRKSIKLEAAEKIKEQLIANIKKGVLSKEEVKKLAKLLSKVA